MKDYTEPLLPADSPVMRRRSCRRYQDREIPWEDLETLCLAGLAAPCARDTKPLELIVVTGRGKLDVLADIRQPWRQLRGAAAVIVVSAKEDKYLQQNCAAATENILIEATRHGVGSCWLGLYPNMDAVAAVRRLLKLPEGIQPVSIVSLGYPAAMPGERRIDKAKIHLEEYNRISS